MGDKGSTSAGVGVAVPVGVGVGVHVGVGVEVGTLVGGTAVSVGIRAAIGGTGLGTGDTGASLKGANPACVRDVKLSVDHDDTSVGPKGAWTTSNCATRLLSATDLRVTSSTNGFGCGVDSSGSETGKNEI